MWMLSEVNLIYYFFQYKSTLSFDHAYKDFTKENPTSIANQKPCNFFELSNCYAGLQKKFEAFDFADKCSPKCLHITTRKEETSVS